MIRSAFPENAVIGDEKLVLLLIFLTSSAGLAAVVSRNYSEPLNRAVRSSLRLTRVVTV